MVFVLVPTESCSWSSAKVNTVTIFLEADIALLSNPYFAIPIPFHSWGVTLELSLPKSFVKYCGAIYWVIVCHYCGIVNCDCLEMNNYFFTCSVFHSSDTCLSIYLGNSCLGNLSIISISFQNREVVVILTICPEIQIKLLTALSRHPKEPCEHVCFFLNVTAHPDGPDSKLAPSTLIVLKSVNLYSYMPTRN